MNCQDATLSLGVYLLGALDPTERAEVDAHLSRCESCQRELAELAGLPTLLDQLRLEDVDPEPEVVSVTPPADLFDRVAARARDEEAEKQRSRFTRFQRLTSIAAAVVVLAGVAVGAVAIAHSGGGSKSGEVVHATQAGVDMTVRLTSQTAGTALDVSVAGLPENEHCWLVAVGRDGSREVAAQWDATYSGRAKWSGSTRIPLSQLTRLELLGSNHQRIDQVAV